MPISVTTPCSACCTCATTDDNAAGGAADAGTLRQGPYSASLISSRNRYSAPVVAISTSTGKQIRPAKKCQRQTMRYSAPSTRGDGSREGKEAFIGLQN
jgi:hypothetical protein